MIYTKRNKTGITGTSTRALSLPSSDPNFNACLSSRSIVEKYCRKNNNRFPCVFPLGHQLHDSRQDVSKVRSASQLHARRRARFREYMLHSSRCYVSLEINRHKYLPVYMKYKGIYTIHPYIYIYIYKLLFLCVCIYIYISIIYLRIGLLLLPRPGLRRG